MPYTTQAWNGPAVEASLSAPDFCAVCLVDNNAAGAPKVKAECHFPVRSQPGGAYNVGALRAVTGGRGSQASFPGAEAGRARARRLLAEYNDSTQGRSEPLVETDIYRAIHPGIEVIERDNAPPQLVGRFAVFNRWTEINSAIEGHFLERIMPGAFKKTLRENLNSVKVLLSHGKDPSMGMTVLGSIEDVQEDDQGASYKVSLFRSVPQLLLDGLRAGVYGASFRADAIKNQIEYQPERSDYNPQGIAEISRTELRLKDFGPTPFPQYVDATSMVRSETDEVYVGSLFGQPEFARGLLLGNGVAALDEQPEPAEATPDETSRSTQEDDNTEPEKEADPSWLIRR